jgi:hypothetical protein
MKSRQRGHSRGCGPVGLSGLNGLQLALPTPSAGYFINAGRYRSSPAGVNSRLKHESSGQGLLRTRAGLFTRAISSQVGRSLDTEDGTSRPECR